MIQDSNPDFRINPDVFRITPELSWINYLVGVSHFAECRENSAGDCMRNANIYLKIPLFRNGDGSRKVIRNRYPGLDHHQQLISSWSRYGPSFSEIG